MAISMILPSLSESLCQFYQSTRLISCCHMLIFCGHGRFFMEKQVMGEFIRILRVSKTVTVSVQLLQTISIMIQNLKSDQAICEFIRCNTFFFCLLSIPYDYVVYFDDFLWKLLADYLFSNEYVNYLITYRFDFQHEELLSYYISFLRYNFLLLSWF